MLSNTKHDATEPRSNSPTITDIARAVSAGAALQMAEMALAAHLKQRDAIGAELTCATTAARDPRQSTSLAQIRLLTAEIEGVDAKIKPARAKVMELRSVRAGKVAAALAQRRLYAARQLVQAVDELSAAFIDLSNCCEEIRRAGDADQHYFHPPVVGLVLEHAQRIIRLAK